MSCQTVGTTRRYNDSPTLTYNSGATYADDTQGYAGFIALVDDAVTEERTRLGVKITHSAASPFSIHQITPLITLSAWRWVGFEAFVDRQSGRHVSIKVTHSDASSFVIDRIRLETMWQGPSTQSLYEAPVDRGCGERLTVRITHSVASDFQVHKTRLSVNMRTRRQPGSLSS